jgi:hypothetical protein
MSRQVSSKKAAHNHDDDEHWVKAYWRPTMGWLYMVICACDFVLFPIFWGLVQVISKSGPITQWNPITLQGAGLVHIAFGAILGIAAWGRSKEKTTFTDTEGNVRETEMDIRQ